MAWLNRVRTAFQRNRFIAVFFGMLFGVFLLSIGAFVFVCVHYKPQPDTMWMEVAKALLGFAFVGAGGAGLSALAFWYEQRHRAHEQELESLRKRLETKRDYFNELRQRSTRAYQRLKASRRRLRAARVQEDGQVQIPLAAYSEHMLMINDVQLEFEALHREVEGNQRAFSSWRKLEQNLKSIDHYLGELIGEWEERGLNSDDGSPIPVGAEKFKWLRDLVGPKKHNGKPSGFIKDVTDPFKDLQVLLTSNLLYAFDESRS